MLAINAGRPEIKKAWIYDIAEEGVEFVREMQEHGISVCIAERRARRSV